MKIQPTSFGNYNQIHSKNNLNVEKNHELKNDIKITKEEKKFFSKLYPEQKESIENYHFYNREGDINGALLGSLFDKRG
jgi:hypothetical protein